LALTVVRAALMGDVMDLALAYPSLVAEEPEPELVIVVHLFERVVPAKLS
jgi:hypothetical protein